MVSRKIFIQILPSDSKKSRTTATLALFVFFYYCTGQQRQLVAFLLLAKPRDETCLYIKIFINYATSAICIILRSFSVFMLN
jgi:hypothetical protein